MMSMLGIHFNPDILNGRYRLAAVDLEGPGSEFAVRFAEVGQITRGGPPGR